MIDYVAADDKIIVKIYEVDKEVKTTSKGGLYVGNVLNPLMDLCQIGKCISVGKKIRYIKDGEILLFSWMVEDTDDNYLGKDEEGDFRFITEKQIYGTVKTNGTHSHIIPKKNYVMAIPQEENEFQHTKSIFQIPIAAINPEDNAVKKMKLKVDDWILCLPYSAVQISVQRRWFWFIHISDILIVNRGEHKVHIYRHHTSPILQMASRKIKTELN